MELGIAQLIGLVEERLQNLKGLGQAIQAAQQACISADVNALRTHDCRKEHHCAEIRRLDLEISKAVEGILPKGLMRAILDPSVAKTKGIDPATARRLSDLFDESETARSEVVRLNRVYGQFLARSCSTLSVMINVVSHCLGVYPSLGGATALHTTFERSY